MLRGRKPAALADTDDPTIARRWVDMATEAGLAARVTAERFDREPTPTWFVEVASIGSLREHFDLDALLADYRACLPSSIFADVQQSLDAAADAQISDLLSTRTSSSRPRRASTH